jgi:hypothetical protein
MKHAGDTHHFFASSSATWVTTDNTRTLQDVIKMMDKEKLAYNLYLVPCKHDTEYEINWFAPQVEGTMHLGTFTFKQGGKR